jgi:multiple sugar transport system substrate-binding protein
MKKLYWISTALALGTVAVVAQTASSYKGPKVEIAYLHGFTGADRPVMEQMVKSFNDAHPNIVVKATGQPWGTTWNQIEPLVASGKAPDVAVINEDQITRFVARGALDELSAASMKTAGIDKNRFFGPLFATSNYKGKSYGVPVSSVAYVMFYNKELLNKNGIKAAPKTRAEFAAATKACTVDKAGKKPGEAGFDAKNLDTWGVSLYNNWVGSRLAYSAILQNGGSLTDKDNNAAFNSPEAVEAVQFLVNLVKDGVTRGSSTEEAELAAFSQGKVCMFPSGQWYLDRFEKNPAYAITFLPRIGTKRDATWGGSSHLTLPKQRAGYDANKRAAALEFINWMTLPAQNLTWTSTGSLPTMKAVADNKKFDGQVIAGIFDKLGSVYATSGFPWGGQVLGPFDAAWERAYLGKQEVKAALDQGVSESNKQIAQVRSQYK